MGAPRAPVTAIVRGCPAKVNARRYKTAICTTIFGGGYNGASDVVDGVTEKNKKILKKLLHFYL